MNMKNINGWTVLSLLALLAGILFYVYWGMRYEVWADPGIYSITVVLVFFGVCGMLLSFYTEKED